MASGNRRRGAYSAWVRRRGGQDRPPDPEAGAAEPPDRPHPPPACDRDPDPGDDRAD